MTETASDAAWLREQRETLGLTRRELSAALGLSHQAVWLMERGDRPVRLVTRLAIEALLARHAR